MISDHKIDVSSLMTVFTNTLKMNRLVGPVVCQNIPAPKKFLLAPHICVTLKVQAASVMHNWLQIVYIYGICLDKETWEPISV